MSFAARHGAWSPAHHESAAWAEALITENQLGTVRFVFADAHGVLRGKTLVAEAASGLLREGVRASTTLLLKDLSGKTVFPVFSPGGGFGLPGLQGAADMILLPDPQTFRVLPWAPHSGWVLCDLFLPDGAPMPLSTRALLQGQLARLAGRSLDFIAGLELECTILRQAAPGPDGAPGALQPLNGGYQYLAELRYDELDPLLEILRSALQQLGLPLRSLEVEFGPGQVELTFAPAEGMGAADQMILARSAIKQVCSRHGYAASFMCRPLLPGAVSSGWHLHQSLRAADGANAFAPGPDAVLSPMGGAYLGGLLAHAAACCAYTTPTINGYRRYRPHANAPDRANWGCDNRGVMVRVPGGAPRLENRAGEPGANPYLAIAAQIAAGLDGIDRGLDPGPASDAPYGDAAPLLPRSLPDALAALADDACLRAAFGAFFTETFIRLKQAEIDRHAAEVSPWEQREYFELL